LRDITSSLDSQTARHYHLGCKKVSKPALDRANEKLDYLDTETNKEYTFITNHFRWSANTIADIYKQRGRSNYSLNGSSNT